MASDASAMPVTWGRIQIPLRLLFCKVVARIRGPRADVILAERVEVGGDRGVA